MSAKRLRSYADVRAWEAADRIEADQRRIKELKDAEVRHIDEKREWMERADKAERRIRVLDG